MPNTPGDDARNELLQIEKRRQLRVIREFDKIKTRLNSELLDLLARIEKQRQIDGNASPGLLFEKARLKDLLDAVDDEIRRASITLGMITQTAQTSAIQIAKDQNAKTAKTAELNTNLSFFDSAATRELVGIAGDGSPLAVHFARLAAPMRNAMFDALFFGIAAGKGNPQIAREVRNAIGGTTAQAMTIVRTETNRAYREASRKFYAETPSIVGWRWLAALDLRTCPICWALHGRVFKTKTKFGTHPNCRCTMVPVFRDEDQFETGPQIFNAKLNDAERRTILGPRRLELWKQGAELTDFVQLQKSAFGIGRRIRPIAATKFEIKPRRSDSPPFPGSIRTDEPTPKRKRSTTPKPASRARATIKPGSPVPTFKTAAEATEYMERRFPSIKFDYSEFAPELLQANVAEMARLLDLYPETAARLSYSGTYADESKRPLQKRGRRRFGGEYAHCSWNGSYIGYNPSFFGNVAKYKKSKEYSYSIGWAVSDKLHATTTHEFGHAVDAWIEANGSATLQPFAFADGRNEVREIRSRILKELKPKQGELSDYAIQGRGDRQKKERFAEGFSMRWNRPEKDWPAFVHAQKKLIEYMQKNLYKLADQKEFRNLSDEAKAAARTEFDDFIRSLGLKVKKY